MQYVPDEDFAQDSISVLQMELEEKYSKYQLVPKMKKAFIDAGLVNEFLDKGIEPDFGIDAMVQMALHIRTKVRIMVGILLPHFECEAAPAQACAEALEQMVNEGFIAYNPPTGELGMTQDISDALKDELEMFQYPLPMVEEPFKVSHNKQTGYATIKGSLILKKNHHDKDINLDHINRVNKVPLQIDSNILAFVENHWRNIDKPKAEEPMEKFQKRRKAFEKFTRTTKNILQGLLSATDGKVWLTHKYDKRGRTYCQGYHFSYQGADWNKALVTLAKKEPLND